MTDHGRVAFEAFDTASGRLFGHNVRIPWETLDEKSHAAWCAVADAVLDLIELSEIADMKKSLRRIERRLGIIEHKENEIMTDIHDEIAAAIAPVLSAVDAVSADVARELADFANQVAPKLSDDEKAQFAGIAQKLLDLDASVNAADPAAPADGGDGETDAPAE